MTSFRISRQAARDLLRLLPVMIFGFSCAAATTNMPVAAVFLGEWPGAKPDLDREIAIDVQAAGYATQFIGPDILTNSVSLRSRNFDLLVLPQARSLPVASMDAVRDYLHSGGRMMALGLPAWESPTFAFNGKCLSKQDYQRIIDGQAADHAIVDFAHEDMSTWNRSVDAASTKTRWTSSPMIANKMRYTLQLTI